MLAFAVLVALPMGSGFASATRATETQPSGEPILRVDAGMHSSVIRASALAPSERFVVTGSADKTVRLWTLPDLELRRVFRVPVGIGAEGRIHDVAISPDERWIAVAGWTGWQWEKSASIYFFDAATERMVARISGLPQPVRNLAYSPDGRYLAVGLMGGAGLRVYDASDYSIVGLDADYGERIVSLDFDSGGRLVTSSADRLVRLYAGGFASPARKRKLSESRLPFEVRFSPDGRRIAVGSIDTALVEILDGRSLDPERTLKPPEHLGMTSLLAVEWSRDGREVYAAGDRSGHASNGIVVWAEAGETPARFVETSRARMGRLLPLAKGRLFWGSEDPSIGILDRDGSTRARVDPPTLDFQGLGAGLGLSSDGGEVCLRLAPGGHAAFSFSRLGRAGRARDHGCDPPRTEGPAPVDVSQDGHRVSVGGKAIDLEPFEIVRHHAWSEQGDRLALATEWKVRLVDSAGAPIWAVDFPVVVHAVHVTRDRRWVVAAVSDGTLRWLSLADGRAGPTLFLHANGMDWIAWSASGHYAASPDGDRYAGWLINRSLDREPLFFRAVQFERVFYAPERVRDATRSGQTATRDLATTSLDRILPPRVELDVQQTLFPRAKGPEVEIRLRARGRSESMRRLVVFVNALPITVASDRLLGSEEEREFERRIRLPLGRGLNEVRVEVDTESARGLASVWIENTGPGVVPRQGDLYVLAIGVGHLEHLSEFDLAYASTDATRIARSMSDEARATYRHVHTRLVADGAEAPTKARILEALGFLGQARPVDTVLLYLAGHGIRSATGSYHFVPRDADADETLRLVEGRSESAESLVGWDAFVDAMQSAVGRRILMVDTCHAQQITGGIDLDWLAKNSASSQFALLAASAPEEKSEEQDRFGAGLFTQGLLMGLEGQADADADTQITLSELQTFASDFVLSNRTQPQKPQFVAPDVLRRAVIARVPSVTSGSKGGTAR